MLVHSDLFTVISSFAGNLSLAFFEAMVEVCSTRNDLSWLLSGARELYQLGSTFLLNSIYIYLIF